jgi:proteasome lid subunit RPN8/RPN11
LITLLPEAVAEMNTHAREGYPHEVVGILAGDARTRTVQRALGLVNERADSPRNRYAVGPLALQRAEQGLEAEGLTVLGYYHTHPDHPAQYSAYDRDHAWPNLSYVILSVVAGEVVDTLAWRLREDRSAMDAETIAPPDAQSERPTPEAPECRSEATAGR